MVTLSWQRVATARRADNTILFLIHHLSRLNHCVLAIQQSYGRCNKWFSHQSDTDLRKAALVSRMREYNYLLVCHPLAYIRIALSLRSMKCFKMRFPGTGKNLFSSNRIRTGQKFGNEKWCLCHHDWKNIRPKRAVLLKLDWDNWEQSTTKKPPTGILLSLSTSGNGKVRLTKLFFFRVWCIENIWKRSPRERCDISLNYNNHNDIIL